MKIFASRKAFLGESDRAQVEAAQRAIEKAGFSRSGTLVEHVSDLIQHIDKLEHALAERHPAKVKP